MIKPTTHVAAGIAVLQPSGENVGQSYPGNDSQLTLRRNGAGQSPVGHTRTHSTLDD
ncbi:MAG: hypothetical protein ABSD88_06180 [Candidatus Korobacteraceae bacterium]